MPKAARDNSSLYWLGTFNNYSEDELTILLGELDDKCKKYVMQEEVGAENGVKHLQLKVAFSKRTRPTENFSLKKIHWEKSCKWKGWQYCAKDDTSAGRRWAKGETVPEVLKVPEIYGWQKDVIDIVSTPPDDRKIHWFWEPTGACGKSSLAKYLVMKHSALLVGGKAGDMKAALALIKKDGKMMPTVILVDIPRSVEHVSYNGFEEIKNGCFFSGKYESGMVVMNPPHFIVFANIEPVFEKLSEDRWVIHDIREMIKEHKN